MKQKTNHTEYQIIGRIDTLPDINGNTDIYPAQCNLSWNHLLMANSRKIAQSVLTVLLSAMIIYLPFVAPEGFIQGTQTGKAIYFLWALWLALPFAAGILLSRHYGKRIPVSFIDLLLVAWIAWIVLRALLPLRAFNLQWAEYAGLALLYLMLRLLSSTMQKWLLTALVVSGLAQAVYGNLQLWGVYSSHHALFKLTGGFFNPGPYGGYLAALFPVTLWVWSGWVQLGSAPLTDRAQQPAQKATGLPGLLRNLNIVTGRELIKTIAAVTLLCMALVLPASQSRAAWVAMSVSAAYLLWQAGTVRRWWSGFRLAGKIKAALPAMAAIVLLCGMAGLYLLKKDSANGRLFIYRNTLSMIADQPISGHGPGGFAARYMHYQAAFFAKNPEAPQAWQAGDNHYAFNEYLRHAAEYGLVGLLLMLALLVTAFMAKKAKRTESSQAGTRPLLMPARAALISVAVFAMTSYPSDILPIKIVAVWALAAIASETSQVKQTKWSNKCQLILSIFPKVAVLIIAAILMVNMPAFTKRQTAALKTWNQAFTLYGMGAYRQSVDAYVQAWPVLQYNGVFLTNYGKALSMAGRHTEAVEILARAAGTKPGTVVYTSLGDSHKALGQTGESETAYLYAWHMAPARFYPQYLLALLYDETGQYGKAVATARYLLQKEVKVPSKAIDEIREAMHAILEKHSGASYLPGMQKATPVYTVPETCGITSFGKQKGTSNATINYNLNIPEKYIETFKGQQNKKRGAYRSVAPTGKFLLQFW
jgi:O-antigen polymerase